MPDRSSSVSGVDRLLARKPENAFGDDVPLYVIGAATERHPRRIEDFVSGSCVLVTDPRATTRQAEFGGQARVPEGVASSMHLSEGCFRTQRQS